MRRPQKNLGKQKIPTNLDLESKCWCLGFSEKKKLLLVFNKETLVFEQKKTKNKEKTPRENPTKK